jgi:hypothetical protein
MERPDLYSIGVGLAIVVLGVLLLLQAEGAIDIDGGWLAAAITACGGGALLASGLSAREQ